MSNDALNRFITTPFICFLSLICLHASAQQTCTTRKESGEPTFAKYVLATKKALEKREIFLYCTEQDDMVKVVLKNAKTANVLQSFQIHQSQSYLQASIPDLDKDGYSDLVLVTEWGSPNMSFKAWRYDPDSDRLNEVLEDGGTEFVRTKSGNIVVHAKGGADAWTYTIFNWKKGKLVPAYSIEETTESAACKYYDLKHPKKIVPVVDAKVLHGLNVYCGVGGAGLAEQGENFLRQ
jgi:hypothetical protein